MRGVFIFVLAAFSFGLLATSVEAASLYIDPAFPKLYKGDAVKLAVRLDINEETGECVNAVDGVITYTSNISPVDVSLGDSIFSVWVEQPTINEDNNTITFAGGIPNGYCGRITGDPRLTNTILEIIVRSPGFTIGGGSDDPTARIDFSSQTKAYLNDGLGTEADLLLLGSEIELSKERGSVLQDPWSDEVSADDIPPEEFSITLEKDENAFSGKYYIVFNTTDKQTGIDQYQVIEEPLELFTTFSWGGVDVPWVTTRSPYVLDDQSLNSTIRVKAIDKAGNEYVATLVPNPDLRSLSPDQLMQYLVYAFAGVAFGGLLFGMMFMYYKRRKEVPEIKTEIYDEE